MMEAKQYLCVVLAILVGWLLVGTDGANAKCGNDLTWSLVNTTLTISGKGDMFNYSRDTSHSPWYDQRLIIEIIRVEEGVSSIGVYAFHNCQKLSHVSIPSSVKWIGGNAFDGCWGLTTVTIPSSVTSIGDRAFVNCRGLTSIEVEQGNPTYRSDDGVLIHTESRTLVRYPCGKTETDYTIPYGIVTLGYSSFISCVNLVNVTISNSVKTIKSAAFYGCTGLSGLILSSSVTTLENQAFQLCAFKSLFIPDSITSIAPAAFAECKNLEFVFYQGSNPPSYAYVFQTDRKISVCVPPDYESSEFYDLNVNSSVEPCVSFQRMFNICTIGSFKDGNVVSDLRENASEWESQTNECFEYKCDSRYGFVKWSICNKTDSKNLQCVEEQCVEGNSYGDKWRVEIELDNVKAIDVNISDLRSNILLMTKIKQEELRVGIEADDNGYLIRVIVYVDEEDTANLILDALEHAKGEGCEYGVLCRIERVVVKGNEIEEDISEGCKIMISIILLVMMLFCVL